ncbi:hypothetical protein FA13DRAFT_1754667 [Coprinellus micaceus]|uniref:cAMP-independent regulatory protein pac2 n=1 Tax=Coprinellus micaceus TaxID=71717 RepID=A0A4Y7TCG2_COPMI|nr:hypothetical protein FA13DRAFT_1754667 [Coprinellus micaceus]
MQRPTLQGVRIRSTRDALQVFNGVATNRLPLITRRLDAEERRAIIPGNVYVWEERGANTEPTGLGMERWTDGMGWGPSREFLFYHQKESDIADDFVSPITPWAQMMRPYSSDARQIPESERLIKQTYSVLVSLPSDRPKGIIRKWHLTAYFSQAKLDQLCTVESIRGVGEMPVPEGWFRSARIGKTRRDSRAHSTALHPPGEQLASIPISTFPDQYASSSSYHHPHSPSPPLYSNKSASHSPNSSFSSSGSSSARRKRSPSLVPLEVLQSASHVPRDPMDIQALRRFAT